MKYSGAGDGQPDGQVQEVDDLPVPQGGLEDHERTPDHIMAGIQTLLSLSVLKDHNSLVDSWMTDFYPHSR